MTVNTPSTYKKFGDIGERLACRLLGATLEGDHRPMFDGISANLLSVAYEIKTRYGFSKDLQCRIKEDCLQRKLKYLAEKGIQGFIVMIVVHENLLCDVYISKLAKHVRPKQMTLLFEGVSFS